MGLVKQLNIFFYCLPCNELNIEFYFKSLRFSRPILNAWTTMAVLCCHGQKYYYIPHLKWYGLSSMHISLKTTNVLLLNLAFEINM